MPPRGSSKHRPGFHALVLTIGFVAGGALTQAARLFLPAGAAKQVLTAGITPAFGPITINLGLIAFTIGPVVIDVSIVGLFGVLVAYLIARSLF